MGRFPRGSRRRPARSEHILDTVRTGKPGLDIAFGMGLFEFPRQSTPTAGAVTFDAAMSERTAAFASTIADTYDFSDIRSVVDVGGGQGTLLAEILRRHTHLHGTLFETTEVAARAEAVLDGADLADRCGVLAGDFFEQVPRGADCYVLANVLHDWDDERAIDILGNCRRSMVRGGRVLIVERLIPDEHRETPCLPSSATSTCSSSPAGKSAPTPSTPASSREPG